MRWCCRWDCVVVVPAQPESFVSKAIAKGPIEVEQVEADTFHVRGPPATCVNIGSPDLGPGVHVGRPCSGSHSVYLWSPGLSWGVFAALHHFAQDCDLVISGPNVGHNAGRWVQKGQSHYVLLSSCYAMASWKRESRELRRRM